MRACLSWVLVGGGFVFRFLRFGWFVQTWKSDSDFEGDEYVVRYVDICGSEFDSFSILK